MVVGADHLIGHAEVADQLECGGFGGEEAIGSGLDDAFPEAIGLDHAAEPRARFDNRRRNAGSCQVVGGGKSGDSSTDDHYTRHVSFALSAESSTAADSRGTARPTL